MIKSQIDDINFDNVCMVPDEVDYVISHDKCSDGFTSALCAHVFFKENYPSRQPVFFPGVYGKLPPLEDVTGKCVLICDFSYKKNDLGKLLSIVKKLLILDHHKTAQEDLQDVPDENKVFRMDHSGAYITWRYFFRERPVPLGIKYVEDNDIWLKAMYKTYEFTAFMFALPFTFEAYEKLLDEDYVKNVALVEGEGMVKQNTSIIKNSIKYAAPKFVQIADKYYFIAHLNGTTLKSELGNKIFTEYPNINASVVYSHNDYSNTTNFSLRSIDTASDVSEIANFYNGGGHAMSAGCSCNYITNTLPCTVIDGHKTYFTLPNIYSGVLKMGDRNYNIVYLNSSHFKRQLSRYLLQTRYKDKSGNTVQECVSIMSNRKTNSVIPEPKYELSAIWNYDGGANMTWYTVSYVDPSLKEFLLGEFKGYKNFEMINGSFVFSIEGCRGQL